MTASRNLASVCAAVIGLLAGTASAAIDTFGAGTNQFTIEFVVLSGATNPASGYGVVNNDYRMGSYEITNDQWTKFQALLGVQVTGDDSIAYDDDPYWMGANAPTNNVSWYEAAQFVNWLNTSTGHQAAYTFTGTQGQSDYTLSTWSTAEADNGTNLYRHKDAFYYLPTEDEWVKAAYWNGASLQTYATKPGETLHQGNGTDGTGWNYYSNGYATNPAGPWDVGSGSEELNGTYDMMGNVLEWMESPYTGGDYGTVSYRGLRGGASHDFFGDDLASSNRYRTRPYNEFYLSGFRVASDIPEPSSLLLLWLAGSTSLSRKRWSHFSL